MVCSNDIDRCGSTGHTLADDEILPDSANSIGLQTNRCRFVLNSVQLSPPGKEALLEISHKKNELFIVTIYCTRTVKYQGCSDFL